MAKLHRQPYTLEVQVQHRFACNALNALGIVER
jgi:hypothetical protein